MNGSSDKYNLCQATRISLEEWAIASLVKSIFLIKRKSTEKSLNVLYSDIYMYWILHKPAVELLSPNIYGCFMNTK